MLVVFVDERVSPEQWMFGIVGLLGAIDASTLAPEQSVERIWLTNVITEIMKD